MQTEFEATFYPVIKNEVRQILKQHGAVLVRPEFLQKRTVFNLPKGHEIPGAWLRVRDEQDKTTMSLKIVDGNKIENQKEMCLKVDDYDKGIEFLSLLGCQLKSYQENKREIWKINEVEIVIDEWPFLEPFVEIEADSEAKVKEIVHQLGFEWSEAIFGAVDILYNKKYNLSSEAINYNLPKIVFEMDNPFLINP